jgi:choline dehydrogenase
MPREAVRTANEEADYVIVGGGSSGCVAAARLTEAPDIKVILIEAGSRDTSPYIHLPVTYYKTTGPRFTWGYKTAPQKEQGGQVTPFVQARVLGGGSSINAQVYMRGTREDYDAWRDEFGCSGWGYDDVLPYFRKAEDNQKFSGPEHGTNGPLKVSDQAFTHPLTHAWLRACQEAGIPYNSDFNSGAREGCGLYQVTNRAGRRSSVVNCYLRPVLRRQNLKLLTRSQVSRLLISDGRATGIEISLGGETRVVRARREVLLAAGAIGTPYLLLKSGVGPADELPITSNVAEGGAFWWIDRREETPDVQFHFLAGSGVEAGIAAVPGGSGCTLNAYLTRPKSRGSVTLSVDGAGSPPVIDPNYLSHEEDLAKTVESVRLGREMMKQPALSGLVRREHFPGPKVMDQRELEQFVRDQARTGYHPAGTCKMGNGNDCVVDTQLRVRGIDGLRVIDNSIMPSIISANTNATAIMVGERAADFVRGNR